LKEEHSVWYDFCNTRRNADFVCNNLHNNGLNAQAIHGGLTQDKRRRILQQFHSKETLILVCTDVAARGLDIPAVSHVYNYDTPKDPKEYVHRIGRTARAGKEGKVINIISSRDYDNFSNVLNKTDFKIEQAVTPFVERINIQKFEGRARREGGRDRYQGSSNSRGSSGGRSYSRGKTSGSGRPYRDRPSSSESSDSRDNSGSERSSYGRSSGSRSYSSGGRRPSSNRSSGRSSSYRRR
jgi:ATP-dependent RNA helicase DeaD